MKSYYFITICFISVFSFLARLYKIVGYRNSDNYRISLRNCIMEFSVFDAIFLFYFSLFFICIIIITDSISQIIYWTIIV